MSRPVQAPFAETRFAKNLFTETLVVALTRYLTLNPNPNPNFGESGRHLTSTACFPRSSEVFPL